MYFPFRRFIFSITVEAEMIVISEIDSSRYSHSKALHLHDFTTQASTSPYCRWKAKTQHSYLITTITITTRPNRAFTVLLFNGRVVFWISLHSLSAVCFLYPGFLGFVAAWADAEDGEGGFSLLIFGSFMHSRWPPSFRYLEQACHMFSASSVRVPAQSWMASAATTWAVRADVPSVWPGAPDSLVCVAAPGDGLTDCSGMGPSDLGPNFFPSSSTTMAKTSCSSCAAIDCRAECICCSGDSADPASFFGEVTAVPSRLR